MSVIVASAPGKVVLSGEYAVLDAAPAVSMALDRRARVRVESGAHALDCAGAVARGDTRLFDSVCESLGVDSTGTGRVALDTRPFVAPDGNGKFGIGSSAALTVALVAALGAASGRQGDGEAAFAAHDRFQGRAGSGVDVATSLAGGLIEYRRDRSGERRITPLEWPQGLEVAFVFAGVAASTGSMLAKLDPESVDYGELAAAADAAAAAWSSADAGRVVEATSAYAAALGEFDRRYSVGIFEGGHAELLAAAEPSGVAYKSCGAGGGDVGAVLSTDAGRVDAFVERAVERGFVRLDARMDLHGVAVSGVAL